jgi:hypothetical protein
LLKTFLVGIVLGVAAAAGALYAKPVVDQVREISYVSVAPNGGNRETFHINIPVDRVMSGAAGQTNALPDGLVWPNDGILAAVSTEMFKLRNERDVIIGIAARTVATEDDDSSSVIDWVLHIPARGTLFINMDSMPTEDGRRVGDLNTGTQEFQAMTGVVTERWVAETSEDEDAPDGRIELFATYVSQVEEAVE